MAGLGTRINKDDQKINKAFLVKKAYNLAPFQIQHNSLTYYYLYRRII